MFRRASVLLACVSLALAAAPSVQARARIAPSGHTTLVSGDGSVPWEQNIVTASEMPQPTIDLKVYHFKQTGPDDACQGNPACAAPGEVWFSTEGYGRNPWAIWHELGHEFDFFVMDDLARNEFRTVFHDNRAWDAQPDPPMEKFAEGYRICAEYGYKNAPVEYMDTAYNYRPTQKQYQRVCSLIRRAGLRHPQGPR